MNSTLFPIDREHFSSSLFLPDWLGGDGKESKIVETVHSVCVNARIRERERERERSEYHQMHNEIDIQLIKFPREDFFLYFWNLFQFKLKMTSKLCPEIKRVLRSH